MVWERTRRWQKALAFCLLVGDPEEALSSQIQATQLCPLQPFEEWVGRWSISPFSIFLCGLFIFFSFFLLLVDLFNELVRGLYIVRIEHLILDIFNSLLYEFLASSFFFNYAFILFLFNNRVREREKSSTHCWATPKPGSQNSSWISYSDGKESTWCINCSLAGRVSIKLNWSKFATTQTNTVTWDRILNMLFYYTHLLRYFSMKNILICV